MKRKQTALSLRVESISQHFFSRLYGTPTNLFSTLGLASLMQYVQPLPECDHICNIPQTKFLYLLPTQHICLYPLTLVLEKKMKLLLIFESFAKNQYSLGFFSIGEHSFKELFLPHICSSKNKDMARMNRLFYFLS